MALTSIIRRSSSSLRPLAARLFPVQRIHRPSIFNALKNHSNFSSRPLLGPSVTSFRHFSASKRPSSDESLIRVIESEIKCASETDDHDRVSFTFFIPLQVATLLGRERSARFTCRFSHNIYFEFHKIDLITQAVSLCYFCCQVKLHVWISCFSNDGYGDHKSSDLIGWGCTSRVPFWDPR